MDESKLNAVLDLSEVVIAHGELIVQVFDSPRPIADKMDFLFEWLGTFRTELKDHPYKDLIKQLKDEIQQG